MWVSCGEQYFPIHQMKPSQEDWQKLVFKRKNCSVLEKLSSLRKVMVLNEIHRCKRRGGGLALLHKTNLKVKRLSQCMSPSMESAVWNVTSSQMSLHIVGVYRPPDKSIPDFLDLFTEYIADLIAEHENIVLVGDFNIHVNDEDNLNAVIFLETMNSTWTPSTQKWLNAPQW